MSKKPLGIFRVKYLLVEYLLVIADFKASTSLLPANSSKVENTDRTVLCPPQEDSQALRQPLTQRIHPFLLIFFDFCASHFFQTFLLWGGSMECRKSMRFEPLQIHIHNLLTVVMDKLLSFLISKMGIVRLASIGLL